MKNKDNHFVIICDAHSKETSYIKIDTNLDNIKSILDCDMVESVRLHSYPSTYMLLDENARLRDIDHKYFRLYEWDLINKAIIIGIEHGEFTDVCLKLNDVMEHVNYG